MLKWSSHFTLLGQHAVSERRAKTKSPADSEPIRVVLCDDQSLVRDALAIALQVRQDLTTPACRIVAKTETLRDCFDSAFEERPDVVLIDILCDLDAWQAADRIASDGLQARVLFVDELLNELHVERILSTRAAGYVTKHHSLSEIGGAIRCVARGEHSFPPAVIERWIHGPHGWRLRDSDRKPGQPHLSARELDVLRLIAGGCSVRECAARLGISANTVENHKSRLMKKLRLRKATQLTRFAFQAGLMATGQRTE